MANTERVILPTEPGSVAVHTLVSRAAASFYDETPIPVDPAGDDYELGFTLLCQRRGYEPPSEITDSDFEEFLAEIYPDPDKDRWALAFETDDTSNTGNTSNIGITSNTGITGISGEPIRAADPARPIHPRTVFNEKLGALLDEVVATNKNIYCFEARRATQLYALNVHVQSHTGHRLGTSTTPAAQGASAAQGTSGWTEEAITRAQLTLELAVELKISERAAADLLHHSVLLIEDLPATFAALEDGAISYRHATVIADEADSLPKAARAQFDIQLAAHAGSTTPAALQRRARRLREKMHPESIRERHIRAAADRYVTVEPLRDGMARLEAVLPAADAFGILNRIHDTAQRMMSETETRTQRQMQNDVYRDLLLNSEHSNIDPANQFPRGVVPTVLLTVPVMTMLGHSDEPAMLEGYGPIDADTARQLAGNAKTMLRLLTDPITGAVLSVGTTRYKVPTSMRLYLRVRDETCRVFGCGRLAVNCEIDHTLDWQYGGHTDVENLAHLCKKHHAVKGYTGWTPKQLGGGVLEWTSPLGRTHLTHPATTIGGLEHLTVVPPPGQVRREDTVDPRERDDYISEHQRQRDVFQHWREQRDASASNSSPAPPLGSEEDSKADSEEDSKADSEVGPKKGAGVGSPPHPDPPSHLNPHMNPNADPALDEFLNRFLNPGPPTDGTELPF
jgi:hypothetical protein